MTGVVLGAAWAGLVLTVAAHRRPRPHLARTLRPSIQPAPPNPLVVRLGRVVLRDPAAPDLLARRAGGVALVVLLLGGPAVLAPGLVPLLIGASAAAWFLPVLTTRRRAAVEATAIEAALPEVVDLLGVAVGAGLNVHLAVTAVARRAEGPVGAVLQQALESTRTGIRLSDSLETALATAPSAARPSLRPLVTALVDADRYGTSLTASLERLADDVRRTRQRRAEEAARRVPVKLLFPLVLCVLPAFALLTVAPVLAGSLRALRL
jgi:tight adherence protein C